jgi:hypothetical protein
MCCLTCVATNSASGSFSSSCNVTAFASSPVDSSFEDSASDASASETYTNPPGAGDPITYSANASASGYASGQSLGGSIKGDASATENYGGAAAIASVTASYTDTITVDGDPDGPTPVFEVNADAMGREYDRGGGGATFSYAYSVSGAGKTISGGYDNTSFINGANYVYLNTGEKLYQPIGFQIAVSASLQMYGSAESDNGGGNFESDFFNTFWLQIVPLTPGVTITSDSGTDYTQPDPDAPVPEPSSVAMGLLSLGLIVVRRKPQRGQSRNMDITHCCLCPQ